jgi:hypothetical protein
VANDRVTVRKLRLKQADPTLDGVQWDAGIRQAGITGADYHYGTRMLRLYLRTGEKYQVPAEAVAGMIFSSATPAAD